MDLGLTDHVVVVTGASGGIGSATALALAAEGARLVLHAGTQLAHLEAWARDQGLGDRALCVDADVRDPEAVERLFERAVAWGGRVDGCIANAGVWPPADEPLARMDPSRARNTIEVDLLGALWTLRSFARALERTGPRADEVGASAVMVGSTAGRFGERGHADYAAAKAGLGGLLLSFKNELPQLDPWARVNIVDPGWTVTDMTAKGLDQPGVAERVVRTHALRQLARPADIARAIVSLASPVLSRHVTGQRLVVAGGMEGRVLWEEAEVDGQAVRDRLQES